MKNNKSILLVEDDRVDALTVQRALKDINVTNPLYHVTNGEEALDFLRNRSQERPCIILLDLNMPRMNGIELLEILKQDNLFKSIPVVVLTTSKDERDRIQSFKMSVAGYMIKPVDYLQFVETMRMIKLYWTLSELPE